MLEEEYEKTRRRLPAHLRRAEQERPFAYEIRPVRDAANLRPLLGSTPIVESAHPSPLSASRGFFGSRPFSRVNELLAQQGATPVDWRLG